MNKGVKSLDRQITAPVSDALNLIRVFAALCVVFGHGFSFFEIGLFKDDSYFPYIQSLAVLVFLFYQGSLLIIPC